MSCANFESQKNFKLMVWGVDGEDECDYEFLQEEYDYVMEHNVKPLKFFELELQGGHYYGVQVKVVLQNEYYDDVHDMDNDECQYYFGMCRSEAVRKFESEVRYINNKLFKELKKIGFIELNVVGRFSNGEVIYEAA